MTESERANRAYGVFQTIARGYDAANERISLGRQRRWKRAAIDGLRLKNTGRGPDLGCGTGDMLELLAERYPGMALVGLDFSPNMLQVAKERLAGFANVSLEQGDAMHLGYADGSFDCVVSAFALRNMASCERAVGEIARVLRPGGVVCCMDSFVPECRALLPLYRLYFKRLMPLIGGGISRRREYDWLCRSTEDFVSAEELAGMLRRSGIAVTEKRSFMFGACVCIVGRK